MLDMVKDPAFLAFAALLAAAVLFFALCIRHGRRQAADQEKKRREAAIAAGKDPDTEDPEDWTPPEPEAYPARVVDMRAVTGNIGGHNRPKTGMSFLVTFLTDDGERREYPVPEELYVTLDLDRTGTLVILNGGFFDFGDGTEEEDTEEETSAPEEAISADTADGEA
jgi:hypothetical protein